MKTWWRRLLIALAVALFIPLPNPHVTDYVPLIRSILIDPDIGSLEFWVIAVAILSVYSGVVFLVLTFISVLRRRIAKRQSSSGRS